MVNGGSRGPGNDEGGLPSIQDHEMVTVRREASGMIADIRGMGGIESPPGTFGKKQGGAGGKGGRAANVGGTAPRPSPTKAIGARLGSPSGSTGMLEFETEMSSSPFVKEVGTMMNILHTLPPIKRFELVQKALRDMLGVVAQAQRSQDVAWAAARESDMRATAIAHQNSRLQTENERLKKFIGLRGEKVDKDMSKIKDLSHELRMAQDDASQRKQEANALARRVAAVEAELDKKVKELAEMVEMVRVTKRTVHEQKQKIVEHETQVKKVDFENQRMGKRVEEARSEMLMAKKAEKVAWSTTINTRSKLLDKLDAVLMINPNHFTDFDLTLHNNHTTITSPGAAGRGGRQKSPFLKD